VGIAVGTGTLVALVPLGLLNIGLRGNPVPAGPPSVYFGIIAGAVVLGMVAIGVATSVALRARPIDAIGVRE
jgi:putative ABC transport system permease protein